MAHLSQDILDSAGGGLQHRRYTSAAAVAFDASRARFCKNPGTFDPPLWIGVFEGLCYHQPSLLERPDLRTESLVNGHPQPGSTRKLSSF